MGLRKLGVAHTYYPPLAQKVLEVREYNDGRTYYAFLQAREHAVMNTAVEATLAQLENTARWELIAGGRDDNQGPYGKERSRRLSALKRLQETVEEQGTLRRVWGRLSGEL